MFLKLHVDGITLFLPGTLQLMPSLKVIFQVCRHWGMGSSVVLSGSLLEGMVPCRCTMFMDPFCISDTWVSRKCWDEHLGQ